MSGPIPFNRELDFQYGVLERVAPNLRRVVARNPSPFTFHGTGTYVVGEGNVAVIDPGPALGEHVDALLAGLEGETITHVLVTHTHRDHSPACAILARHTDAPTFGFGPHGSGRFERGIEIEEGADRDFTPAIEVRHGDVIEGDGFSFECVYTPGHTSNHVCFRWREERALFSGDHVMGWSTTIVSPPDGDMAAYMESLDRLLEGDDVIYWPTHGAAIENPAPYVRAYKTHRRLREQQILGCLRDGLHTVAEMVPVLYAQLPRAMYPAASRSTFSTLIMLADRGEVLCDGDLSVTATYRLR